MEINDTGNSYTDLLQAAFNAPNSRTIVFTPVYDSHNTIVDFTYSLISSATIDFFEGKDFTGKNITDVLADGRAQANEMKRVIETGETHKWIRFYETGPYKNQWFEVSDARIGGRIVRVWDNVTQRRQEEEDAKDVLTEKTEEKYLTLFNSIDLGFCIIEVIFDAYDKPYDYVFLEYNPAFEKQTGLKDARGISIKTLNPNQEQHWFDLYGKIARTGETMYFEQEAAIINGWYEVSAFRVGDTGNTVAVIFNDITIRKKAEQELSAFNIRLEEQVKERTASLNVVNGLLEQKNEELAKSNRELESFNYVASHDLQEPLRKIKTFLTLIKQRANDPDAVKGYMEKINTSAERMSALISDVLTYSRLASERQLIPTDLNKILTAVLSDYEIALSEKNAVVDRGILPVIASVPSQMQQLFSNLISNSLKYSKDNPVIKISGSILPGSNPKTAKIIISDNGIGFDSQYSDQIFKLFQRLHGKSEYSGTGIGLSICKKIVEQHGGTISAASVPGSGATFTIHLPV